MRAYWVSWWTTGPEFEIHWPWWESGYDMNGNTSICAAICAPDEAGAEAVIYESYDVRPEKIDFRFIEAKSAGWKPYGGENSRFRKADWMPVWDDAFDPVEMTRKQSAAVAEVKRRLAEAPLDVEDAESVEGKAPITPIRDATARQNDAVDGQALLVWQGAVPVVLRDFEGGVFLLASDSDVPAPPIFLKTGPNLCYLLSNGEPRVLEKDLVVLPVSLEC